MKNSLDQSKVLSLQNVEQISKVFGELYTEKKDNVLRYAFFFKFLLWNICFSS